MGTTMSQGRKHLVFCGFDISVLPEKVLARILLFVPGKDVVRSCSLVNKYWLQVCRCQSLWKRKCLLEKIYRPEIMGPPPKDFIVHYFQNPYGKNLLQNTTADGCRYWTKSGEYPSVEEAPYGSIPIAICIPFEETQGRAVQNWVTSYTFSSLTQNVFLLDRGCSEFVLDKVRPTLYASAWCSARWDCKATFIIGVKLRDFYGKTIDHKTKEFLMKDENLRCTWHKVELKFTDYPPGVRSIQVRLGGVDLLFWKGSFGSKFTLPCLRFMLDELT